eukprot:CAMPEP_0116852198 /NCGR_PEP_ID=MMETSP0418-20121206/17156_1 /TAXON_ID=1158023 /ORGANISM="Astrosyne radiata, Strain 13vi08-1A" /LENGTH=65 /DNA_ID=CAMNT_0004484327 /DNA_START=442 /DNA_END=639 /DNA_ORIENTATION=+
MTFSKAPATKTTENNDGAVVSNTTEMQELPLDNTSATPEVPAPIPQTAPPPVPQEEEGVPGGEMT